MTTTPRTSTLARLSCLLVAEHDLQPESLRDDVKLESLGIDSLGTIELLWMVEEQFGIELPTEPAHGLETLGDIVRFIDALVAEQGGEVPAALTMAPNVRDS